MSHVDACVYTDDGYRKAKVRWQLPGNHSIEAKTGLQSNTYYIFEGLLKNCSEGRLSKVNKEEKDVQ